MPSYKLLIQRFPYGGREDTECVSWLMDTFHKAKLDPRFSEVRTAGLNDTPITMTRNRALADARGYGFDFVLMVDSDMTPDCELGEDPTAVPFFDCAVEYALKSPKPCVIAAPYVGPPPHENIYVFRWGNRGNTLDPKAANTHLDQFTREEAAVLAGVQEVGALPTGLMLVDLRALAELPHPWTYYEFAGAGEECPACHQKARGPEARKDSTEDVTFTRDLGLLGVPILCAWSSWAGHNKRYIARKPRPYTTDIVSHKMRDAIGRRVFAGDELVDVKPSARVAKLIADAEHRDTNTYDLSRHNAGEQSRPRGRAAEQRPEHPLNGDVMTRLVFPQPGTLGLDRTADDWLAGQTPEPRPPLFPELPPVHPDVLAAGLGQWTPPAAPRGEPLTPLDLLRGVPLG